MPCAGIEKSTEKAKEKHQERERIVYHGDMERHLNLKVDRSGKTTLAEQIRSEIATAIESGVLEPGARLPLGRTSPPSSASPGAPCGQPIRSCAQPS